MKYSLLVLALLLGRPSLAISPAEQKETKSLKCIEVTDVKKDGTATTTSERVEKILTESGRTSMAIQRVHFSKSQHSFKLLEAYTLTDGKKTVVPADKVVVRAADKAENGISDIMEAVIPFERLSIGTEVHYRYQLVRAPGWGKIFSDIISINNSSLADEETYTYRSELPLLTADQNLESYYEVKKTESPGSYVVTLKPTPLAYGIVGVSLKQALLSVTTATNWNEITVLETPLFENELKKPLPEQYLKIANDSKALKTPKEVFDKVASELAKKITYSGDWRSVAGRVQPRPMDKVSTEGKGDCKDYTTAMVAILRSLGYQANPFLTFRSTGGLQYENAKKAAQTPNPSYFNHVIVHVKDKSGKNWWIDPTNPYVQSDVVSSDILGNFGLLLDGKSTDIAFLPEQNEKPADSTSQVTLKLLPDDSVEGTVSMNLTPGMYNQIGMVERLYGKDGMAKLVGVLLNPMAPKTKVTFTKATFGDPHMEFKFHGPGWVSDTPKVTVLTYIHPLALMQQKFDLNASADLGEPGTSTAKTTIQNQKTADSIASNCVIRSRWLDVDRIVENKGADIEVIDIVKIKKRFIAKADAQGLVYEAFLSQVDSCVRTSSIVLKVDEQAKAMLQLQGAIAAGPPLEEMTDQEADRLRYLTGPEKSRGVDIKLLRYYDKKIAANPKDAQAYFSRSNAMNRMGFVVGDTRIPEYVLESVEGLKKAVALAKPGDEAMYRARLISNYIYLDRLNDAVTDFVVLNEKYPQSYDRFEAGAEISIRQKKFDEAQNWILSGEPFALTEMQKDSFHSTVADLFESQKQWSKSIVHREYFVKKEPKNAWAWHNLAILFYKNQAFDRAIELEQKALSLSDFGAARHMISDCYHEKFVVGSEKTEPRLASNILEDFLQKSVKYNPRNVPALVDLALMYHREYGKTREEHTLAKGRSYLDKAIQIEPDHSYVKIATDIYSIPYASPEEMKRFEASNLKFIPATRKPAQAEPAAK